MIQGKKEVWRPGHRLKNAKDSHNGAMCRVNLMLC